MSIKMGASGAIFQDRFTLDCHVVETRQYPYRVSDCWGVTQKALNNGIYLIFNICWENGYNPTDEQWRHRVEDVVQKLISYGGNKNNCRITIINEPMADKHNISKEKYAHLINIAYSQVRGRFLVGAGNEEFALSEAKGGMYQYILSQSNFDILDIHIQGSCLTEANCNHWCAVARSWAMKYNKILDCTEANYSDVAKESGYKTLLMQLSYAEQVECIHFPMVFIGLSNEDKYKWLSFIYNGVDRTVYGFDNNGNPKSYWQDYKRIMKEKAPITEIKPIIERSKDGMIISTQTINSYEKYLANLENELLAKLGYLQEENITWSVTQKTIDALKIFQKDIITKYPNIMVDGKCGRQTFRYLIEEIKDSIEKANYRFALEIYASPTK